MNYSGKTKNDKLWCVSIAFCTIGLIICIAVLLFTADERLIRVFGIYTDTIVSVGVVLFSLGLVSLPLFLYKKRSKKNRLGWIICSVLSALLLLGCVVVFIFARWLFGADYSYVSLKSPDGKYELVKEIRPAFMSGSYKAYYAKTGLISFKEVYGVSTDGSEYCNVEWMDDKVVIVNFVDN